MAPAALNATQASPHPPAAPRRRRRTNPAQQGESSREASAESNDETTSGLEDDTASLTAASIAPSLSSRDSFETTCIPSFSPPGAKHGKRHALPPHISAPARETDGEGEYSEGSAGHDGDISSATAPSHRNHVAQASDSTSPRPKPTIASALQAAFPSADDSNPPSPRQSPHSGPPSRLPGHGGGTAPPAWAAAPTGFLSNLSAEDIQDHIKIAIAGDSSRAYKINEPPQGRPVRIYADGVYDLLHYGHMLQLRQCKLAFPSVHLMVGVCSDELVRAYKAAPVLTSAERYESVRHCKWVDEVIEDAPWQVDAEFRKEHRIDYIAHDEEPYVSAGSDDVYAYAKSIGAFLPTKRTNGVSTSELLQRIVEGYREGDYDVKFIKLGKPDLCSTRAGSETGTGGGSKHADEATVDGNEPVDKGDEEVDTLAVPALDLK